MLLSLACATFLLASALSVRTRLLPGSPTDGSSKELPQFLFLFRGVHGDFRLQEVRAVAETLGFGADFKMQPVSCVQHSPSSEIALKQSASGLDQHYFRFASGDVGPLVFQWVSLPNAEAAAAVASRCVLVRGAFDVWALAEFDQSDRTACLGAQERWALLAQAVCNSDSAIRQRMLSQLGSESWKMDITSFGAQKPYSLSEKIGLFEMFHDLVFSLPGNVDLQRPAHVLCLVEDMTVASVAGIGLESLISPINHLPAHISSSTDQLTPHRPSRLYLARQLSAGAGHLLTRFSLTSRKFIGRTSLPADLSFLMANQARLAPSAVVLDPFCGTCSTLLSCARFGASVIGIDIDERALSMNGIRANFVQAQLPPPLALMLADATTLLSGELLPEKEFYDLDAIVTDPPYGLLEGLGALYMPMSRRIAMLMAIGACRLRVGGTLVFLLPVPAQAPEPQLPPSSCMELISLSHLVTMRKSRQPSIQDLQAPPSAQSAQELEELALPWERWWELLGCADALDAKQIDGLDGDPPKSQVKYKGSEEGRGLI